MKIAIVGSREFARLDHVRLLVQNLGKLDRNTVIVSGGARGVDDWAEKSAKAYKLCLVVYPADWTQYGRSAGPIRNAQIVEAADEAHIFWDGKSKGTKNVMGLFEKAGKPITVHCENGHTYPVPYPADEADSLADVSGGGV